jgi:hypothetical protein
MSGPAIPCLSIPGLLEENVIIEEPIEVEVEWTEINITVEVV